MPPSRIAESEAISDVLIATADGRPYREAIEGVPGSYMRHTGRAKLTTYALQKRFLFFPYGPKVPYRHGAREAYYPTWGNFGWQGPDAPPGYHTVKTYYEQILPVGAPQRAVPENAPIRAPINWGPVLRRAHSRQPATSAPLAQSSPKKGKPPATLVAQR